MFFSDISGMGAALARQGHHVYFGGANLGLMGALGKSVIKNGGKCSGIIPTYFNKPGKVIEGLTELIVTKDLTQRKELLLEKAEALIVYPGGLGTLDEALHTLALIQLGKIKKKLIFVNFLSYWDTLFSLFTEMQQQKMVGESFTDLFVVVEEGTEALQHLR